MLPRMLQDICRRDIAINIGHSEIVGPLTVAIDLSVKPREIDDTLAALARAHGIRDPQQTAMTTDLLLWIKSLRRSGDSPMQVAWNQFRREDMPVDVPLFMKSFRLLPCDIKN